MAGKGKLTDSKTDVLQSYYGLAIRENLDVTKMAKTIWACLLHVASTDGKTGHAYPVFRAMCNEILAAHPNV